MTEMRQEGGSLTGLTENEAQEFHSLFMKGFFIFTIIAVVAHLLVWSWRPWLPGEDGYSALDRLKASSTLVAQVTVSSTLLRG